MSENEKQQETEGTGVSIFQRPPCTGPKYWESSDWAALMVVLTVCLLLLNVAGVI